MLSKYNGRNIYIDGFAGPGRYKGGEDGSPIIALKALLEHPHFKKPPANLAVMFLIHRRPRRSVLPDGKRGTFPDQTLVRFV
jgi:hypothetical protein